MTETWVEKNKFNLFEKYFKNFKLSWIEANRTHTMGRAIGGMLIGIKKEVNFIAYSEGTDIILKVEGNCIRIVSVYLNYSFWEKDFENLVQHLKNVYTDNLIVIGDFNARTRDRQIIEDEDARGIGTVRKSEDREINNKGKEMLEMCNDLSLVILNGRSPGDEEGRITFIGGMGKSVIDYGLMSYKAIRFLKSFKIESQLHSDHLPVELNLEIEYKDGDSFGKKLLPKIKWTRSKQELYNDEIDRNISGWLVEGSYKSKGLADIVSMVSKVGSSNMGDQDKPKMMYREKWFDIECDHARKLSFRFLNAVRKNPGSEVLRRLYREKVKVYNDICKQKQEGFFKSLAIDLKTINSTKKWWEWAKNFKGPFNNPNGNLTSVEYSSHFSKLLNETLPNVSIYAPLLEITDEILDVPFVMEELEEALSLMKDKKAPGEDRLPMEFLKYGSSELKHILLHALNDLFHGNSNHWDNKSILLPFHKKGSRDLVDNYRGITLVSSRDKVAASVMLIRLNKWINSKNILKENQAGFRRNYSTVDNVFNLDFLVRYLWYKGHKKVYCFFIDFKAAFDGVNRSCLFFKLHEMGVSFKFIKMLEVLYKDTQNSVWDGNSMSEWFTTECGVKQGCKLSPVLFSLFLNDLVDKVGLGVDVRGTKVNMFLYADDINFVADDPSRMQMMINRLKSYCDTWGLRVNMSKSKIMVMRRTGASVDNSFQWYYGQERIEVVGNYKYLGLELKYNLNIKEHLLSRANSTYSKLNSVWSSFVTNKYIDLSAKLDLFNAIGRSTLCYLCQVFGYREYDEMEAVLRKFIKRITKLPERTANYILRVECGVKKMHIFTLKCHTNYILDVLFKLDNNRFPNFFAKIAIDIKLEWFQEWIRLGEKCGVTWDIYEETVWRNNVKRMIEYVDSQYLLECIEKARETSRHGLYNKLVFLNGGGYFKSEISEEAKCLLFKTRVGMLRLNDVPWRSEISKLCSCCNLKKNESVMHFIGECPIYRNFRMQLFGKPILSEREVIDILNGMEDWKQIYQYITFSLSYRNILVAEYNY